MRRIWIFILLLAVSSQLSAVNGQQSFSETENLKTLESENSLANDKRLKAKGKAHSSDSSQVFSF